MKVISDYKSMIRKEYITDHMRFDFNSPSIRNEIDNLYIDLEKLDNKYGEEIQEALELMTKLYCYRLALKMKVVGSIVPDAKDPENKYAQARGAVNGLNKKRMWISHYLGPVANYLDTDGHLISNRIIRDGQVPIIKKTIEKLLAQIDEL